MSKHLYIIGNGFDLHHGINSSYRDFMKWMNVNYCDIMLKVDAVYGDCDNDWWSDFENQLASLNAIQYSRKIAFENRPDLTSEHCDGMWQDAQIEVENQLYGLYSDIRECFHEWIMQLNPPLESKKVKLIIQESVFLNFNYTKTLENHYGINQSNILHIHGCIDEDEDFILGHGKSYEELDSLNTEDLLDPSGDHNEQELVKFYEEQANSTGLHEQLARNAAIGGVASQRKPVDELIKKNENFFNSLHDITHIHVYGMSLSEVDMPYLERILSTVKSVKWEFSDYKGFNSEKINIFCRNNHIKEYNIIELKEIIDTAQLQIPFTDWE